VYLGLVSFLHFSSSMFLLFYLFYLLFLVFLFMWY